MLIKDLKPGAKFIFGGLLYVISDRKFVNDSRIIYRFDGLEAMFDESGECKKVWPGVNALSSSPHQRAIRPNDLGALVNLSWMVAQFSTLVNVFSGETKPVTEEEVTFYPEAIVRVTY